MSSVFTQDQRYLAWNLFMLHLMNDYDFIEMNSNPISIYPEWADFYADKVKECMSDLLKTATREAFPPATINIPRDQEPSSPIPLNPNEPYQGLLMIAPQFVDIPSSPSSISSGSSSFSDRDSPASFSSAHEESPPTFSKVIARPVPVIRRPSSGYISPSSSSSSNTSSCSSSAYNLSNDSADNQVQPRLQRRRRVNQRSPQPQQQQDRPNQQPQSPQQNQPANNLMCSFCRRNSEPREFYTSHNTKDSQGNVICPILFAYKCEACGATGPDAHTRSYCPMASVVRSVFSEDSNVQIRYANYARTARVPQ
ncbi:uncharacterized protein LOC128387621 [Panonychus citri]|uniref:uncharacterized protein LOC128387621 n=1 Tax=Panonychus citri TaxID=50023 RepID=UPI002307C4FF|nr:uncharacterized protein LOC128387621 [Panonychus citri]